MKLYIIFLILFILLISGCTRSTSVMLKTVDGDLEIEGFGRGQAWFSLMCAMCPHVGAKVEARTLDGKFICSGSNEVIVSDTSNIHFKVKCNGLEEYEGKRINLFVEGFTGGKLEEVIEFKFDKRMVVNFEKI